MGHIRQGDKVLSRYWRASWLLYHAGVLYGGYAASRICRLPEAVCMSSRLEVAEIIFSCRGMGLYSYAICFGQWTFDCMVPAGGSEV